MIASIQGFSKIYSILLRLFPRDFQKEFREEMEDVFTSNLEEAAQTSTTLVVRACFFELIDLPVNLLVEYLSNLRKGNFMKTLSYEVGRSRAVLMAALGMMVSWVLISWVVNNWVYSHNSWMSNRLWIVYVAEAIRYTLPVIFCGLMLGIAASSGRRAFLRIGLWTVVGGILGYLVNITVSMITSDIILRTMYLPSRETNLINLLIALAVTIIYGFFNGAGLGFAIGGWKSCLKFALVYLVANAVGLLAVYFIFLSDFAYTVPLGPYGISYIVYGIQGALAGGIIGWLFVKERQPNADPLMRTGNA